MNSGENLSPRMKALASRAKKMAARVGKMSASDLSQRFANKGEKLSDSELLQLAQIVADHQAKRKGKSSVTESKKADSKPAVRQKTTNTYGGYRR